MKRKGSEVITRLSTLAMLAALGFVLMTFAQIPYPLAPWLKIEVSEVVVLIAFALYGFWGGFSVALLKTLLNMAVFGLSKDPLGVGYLTAMFGSLLFLLGLLLFSHVFRFFSKGFWFRVLSYVLTTLLLAGVLTFLNGLFITPTYLSASYCTCFSDGVVDGVIKAFGKLFPSVQGEGLGTYSLLIFLLYFPFNALKGALVFFLYEILFNRLIFVFLARSPRMKKYFLGPIFKTREKEEEKTEKKEEENRK